MGRTTASRNETIFGNGATLADIGGRGLRQRRRLLGGPSVLPGGHHAVIGGYRWGRDAMRSRKRSNRARDYGLNLTIGLVRRKFSQARRKLRALIGTAPLDTSRRWRRASRTDAALYRSAYVVDLFASKRGLAVPAETGLEEDGRMEQERRCARDQRTKWQS